MEDNPLRPIPTDLSNVTIDTRWEYDYSNRIKRRIRLNDGRVIETQRLTNAEVERYLAQNPSVVLPKQIHPVFTQKPQVEPVEPTVECSQSVLPESLQGRVFGNLTVTEDEGKAIVKVTCKCGKVIEKFNRKFLIVSGQKSCSRECPFSMWSRKKPVTVPITASMMQDEPEMNPEPVTAPTIPLTRTNTSKQILAVIEAAKKINIDDVHSLLAALETIEINIPSALLPFLGNPYLGVRKAKANLRALGCFITSIAGTKE